MVGALLTSLYIFRLIGQVFFGPLRHKPTAKPGPRMRLALGVLALLAIAGGFVELPATFGGASLFGRFLSPTLPEPALGRESLTVEILLLALNGALALLGIYLAYRWYVMRRPGPSGVGGVPGVPLWLQRYWRAGWGFDRAYGALVVWPFMRAAHANQADAVDLVYGAIAGLARAGHRLLAATQSGFLRWYVAVMAAGLAILLLAVLS